MHEHGMSLLPLLLSVCHSSYGFVMATAATSAIIVQWAAIKVGIARRYVRFSNERVFVGS